LKQYADLIPAGSAAVEIAAASAGGDEDRSSTLKSVRDVACVFRGARDGVLDLGEPGVVIVGVEVYAGCSDVGAAVTATVSAAGGVAEQPADSSSATPRTAARDALTTTPQDRCPARRSGVPSMSASLTDLSTSHAVPVYEQPLGDHRRPRGTCPTTGSKHLGPRPHLRTTNTTHQ
jgi:hypothetical protein